jgi:hypothetical protein
MKKLIFILVFLFSHLVLNGSNKIVCLTNDSILLNKTYTVLSKELGLDSAHLTIFISSAMFDKNNYDLGSLNQINDSTYVINISSDIFKEDAIRCFIHELIHISQSYQKRLVIRKRFVWFEGKTYWSDSIKDERPYEIEAMSKTEELFNKYHKELKK